MSKKELTKKDVMRLLPRKTAKLVLTPLDKLISKPLGLLSLIAALTMYAKSPRSPAAFKKVYNRAVASGVINRLIVVSLVTAAVNAMLYAVYKKTGSKKGYLRSKALVADILRSVFYYETLFRVLLHVENLAELLDLFFKQLAKHKQLPETVRSFVRQLNSRNPKISEVLKAMRKYNVKVPWLSKMSTLLNKLKTFR